MDSEHRPLREAVERLCAIRRPSASPGERAAAEWLAGELRALGLEARIEPERAHGTYWWPLGLLCAAAGIAGAAGSRRAAAVVGALAAGGVVEDISAGAGLVRRLLPRRTCFNVVAEAGDPRAQRTVVLLAHHDAAHSGLIFHPAPLRLFAERLPALHDRAKTTPMVMAPVVAGPALVGLGGALGSRRLRRAGAVLGLGAAAAFADVALREVVPGANDNASAVAALLGLARALRDDPVPGVRVLLVSTGAEESFMEGMRAFARRHFRDLPTARTHVVCLESVGSPELVCVEGEGMLRMRDYDADFKRLVSECADDLGLRLHRGLRIRNATDGLIALRAGYPAVVIGSMDHTKFASNYHWPTDVPQNVDYGTVARCVRLCHRILRRLAAAEPAAAPAPPVPAAR